jgi:hypothetical protein
VGRAKVKKWEYNSQVMKIEGVSIGRDTLDAINKAADACGAEGWEMVGFQQVLMPGAGLFLTLIYKRPVL